MSTSGKPFVREVSRYGWFLRHPRYLRYMAREVTCVFIGLHALILLLLLRRLSEGREAYEAFLHDLSGLAGVALQVVVLAFAVYHSMSWFNVTPKALPVQIGEKFLPGAVIIAAHYAGWLIATVALLVLAGVF